MRSAFVLLIAWNVVTFLLFGLDKLQAKRQRRRISEKTLLLTSLLLGGIGGIVGMTIFHHKIRKLRFRVILSIAAVVTALLPYLIYFQM